MNVFDCPREQDVLDEIDAGRWPARASDDLMAHVTTCASCRDLVDIVPLLREDAEVAREMALVPSAGQVWWRAELRARHEAARAVQRPMTLVQMLAAACTVAALLALAALTAPVTWSWIARLADLGPVSPVDLTAISGFVGQWGGVLALALGAWLVLAPVAVYLVLRDD